MSRFSCAKSVVVSIVELALAAWGTNGGARAGSSRSSGSGVEAAGKVVEQGGKGMEPNERARTRREMRDGITKTETTLFKEKEAEEG